MPPPPSRRQFLVSSLLASAGAVHAHAQAQAAGQTPGAPPVLGVLPPVGPDVAPADFAAAEKLLQVKLSPAERAEAAGNWRGSMAPLLERRTGPRTVSLSDTDAPASTWQPLERTGAAPLSGTDSVQLAPQGSDTLPTHDEAIAFSSVVQQAAWLMRGALTSARLTRIYLERLKRYDPQLKCVITLTEAHALEQARAADAEMAAGRYRGPLHGIPYGAKDLLDTAGIATTWGAEPFRNRVPVADAAVIRKLHEAGAVLVAKLSLGALALNDVWFGGQTKNPWVLEEGASGSSAGPASAVAAGLVSFAIGSETQGSIISPSMRCGVTGLRPTFGRVPRTGAMTLSWSCDKLGPMARRAEDTVLVLSAISGADAGDLNSRTEPLLYNGERSSLRGVRIGYFDAWMKEAPATDVDRHALEVARQMGADLVPVTLPPWPYDSLNLILFAEAAAAFEDITLDHRVDLLRMQTPEAWPNTFRQARFTSAVDFVQADRLRRKVAVEMARLMSTVDLLLVPSLRDEMMVIANFTGHPSLTLPAGFVSIHETRTDWLPESIPLVKLNPPAQVPHGITLIGQMFAEGPLVQAGHAFEQAFGIADRHPPMR